MANMPARVAMNASQMYANNLTNPIDEFWNKEKKEFELKLDDDIIKGCLITHGGTIVHPSFLPTGKKRNLAKDNNLCSLYLNHFIFSYSPGS